MIFLLVSLSTNPKKGTLKKRTQYVRPIFLLVSLSINPKTGTLEKRTPHVGPWVLVGSQPGADFLPSSVDAGRHRRGC